MAQTNAQAALEAASRVFEGKGSYQSEAVTNTASHFLRWLDANGR